ncbi:flagellin [Comamonas aquatica]|jgi:flagellin|uniref:Flagellin n=1 Tax=Comamonas aquatica TaxID=225991 RepID=A0AA35DB89_9BURK|nr:flagellin [Comamonas aquatica]CAB5696240.1 A-type flagellin [Comamonas aquatica]CAB5710062.1 A-type flagellin [Comamonas aquatica]CAC9180026.1 A-type flagellin [Comamonas aquatica]CAC9678774.1 A-type flagellin [Comamonas aquatica]
MAMTINTNVVSINAQRNLGLSGGSLSTSMQRLSSGLRVNSAKDDAAGLAIAERMSTQVRGFAVASRNANDGISLAQTAEGALGKVGDMLQRMRELAVQSGNATNSKSDREALNAELVQLRSEVDRVAKTTSFNGSKLLDGGFTGGVFQVGANAGDNITVGALADTRADKLGQASYATASATVDATAKDAARDAMTNASVTITVSGADGVGVTVQIAKDENVTSEEALGRFIEAVNSKTADTGVTAFLADDGKSIEYRATVGEGQTAASAQVAGIAGFAATGTAAGSVGIDKMDIKTQAGAWESLQRIDSAIDKVNSARAELGAIQTRFEKSIENIDIMQENISAARGRITDADFAKETANLSRTQILQQAGTAMVAQANQLPQNVLKLLQ